MFRNVFFVIIILTLEFLENKVLIYIIVWVSVTTKTIAGFTHKIR